MERSGIQTFVLNLAAVVVGIVTLIVVNTALIFVFGLLLRVPILMRMLSWPSTPMLYALSAANIGAIAVAGFVCEKICGRTRRGYRPGMLVLGVVSALLFAFSAYSAYITYGFCDALLAHAFSVLFSFVLIGKYKD